MRPARIPDAYVVLGGFEVHDSRHLTAGCEEVMLLPSLDHPQRASKTLLLSCGQFSLFTFKQRSETVFGIDEDGEMLLSLPTLAAISACMRIDLPCFTYF